MGKVFFEFKNIFNILSWCLHIYVSFLFTRTVWKAFVLVMEFWFIKFLFEQSRRNGRRGRKIWELDSVRNRPATKPVMLKVRNVKLSFDIWLVLYMYFILYSWQTGFDGVVFLDVLLVILILTLFPNWAETL